jgi:hypothetical protein
MNPFISNPSAIKATENIDDLISFRTVVSRDSLLSLKENLIRLANSEADDDIDDYQYLMDEITDSLSLLERLKAQVDVLINRTNIALKKSNGLLDNAILAASEED